MPFLSLDLSLAPSANYLLEVVRLFSVSDMASVVFRPFPPAATKFI